MGASGMSRCTHTDSRSTHVANAAPMPLSSALGANPAARPCTSSSTSNNDSRAWTPTNERSSESNWIAARTRVATTWSNSRLSSAEAKLYRRRGCVVRTRRPGPHLETCGLQPAVIPGEQPQSVGEVTFEATRVEGRGPIAAHDITKVAAEGDAHGRLAALLLEQAVREVVERRCCLVLKAEPHVVLTAITNDVPAPAGPPS